MYMCVYFVTVLIYVLQQPLTAGPAKTKANIAVILARLVVDDHLIGKKKGSTLTSKHSVLKSLINHLGN